jgi:parallel beta-helix repeat protein
MTAFARLLLPCLISCYGLAPAGPACHAAELFLAPDGNDAWSGSAPVPNAGRTDGPLATLAAATTAVRALRAAHPDQAVTVSLRGGTYPLASPWHLGPEDSGADGAPVTYAAYKEETPIISGGVRLHGFTIDAHGRWTTPLPEVAAGTWTFSQLWVSGQRRYRPRSPVAGYHVIAGAVAPSPAAQHQGYDRFRFNPGDLLTTWSNPDDLEVLTFHQWEMSRLRIASIDQAREVVQFTGHTCSSEDWAALKAGWRYQVDNVAEALARPGEWYLDRPHGLLTYIPMPGEDPAATEVIAPKATQLLVIAGDPGHGHWVEQVRLQNITFAHTAWTLPHEGYSFGQADILVPAAIAATGMRHGSISGCAIAHTGGWAVDLAQGCSDDRVDSCALYDLGAGGVKIGDSSLHDGHEEEVAHHNTVANSLIAFAGRIFPAAIGVWIGQSHSNTVEHCEIHDLYYTGISLGWSWGYGRSNAHHNTIAYNHISLIGQGVLSDMGGIYNLGVSPGTVFHHNRIHDIASFSYGGWGLYTDEGSSGVTMENNIVYRTSASGFHQHYGADNILRNNIFAYGHEAQLMRTRDEDHLSFTIEHNLVIAHGRPILGSNWTGDARKFRLDHNLYWDEAGTVTFSGASFADWQKRGQDAGSVVADPLCADPAHGDFTLGPASPAIAIGFVPIDAQAIGLQRGLAQGQLRAYLPHYDQAVANASIPAAFPPPPGVLPPVSIRDDFEDTPVGERAVDAITSEQTDIPAARIRVTTETAASGTHSLKFSDAPGQHHRFDPHLYYQTHFSEGTVEGAFSIRLEAGAEFMHEWRTDDAPYQTGPSLRIAHGMLSAGDKELMAIPTGSWLRIAISAALGADAHGHWDLTVTLPGGPTPRTFHDLPCSDRFTRLNWVGFVSDADAATVFYIDDVSIHAASHP